MAPPPEYDKEPKAPDKSLINISKDDSKVRYNNIKDQPPSSDIKSTNSKVNTEVENNKHVETLDDGQLRALLDEAITYKCPKDREGKSSLFKELLEEVEQDEQCEAAARVSGSGRGARRGRGRHEHHSSLQDLVAAMAAESAPRRARHSHAHHAPPAASVSARTHHGGSLPSGVDTSFLLSEEPARGGYLATVRCVNPPPLAERRVSASDANPPADLDLLTRRSKPIFPMTYTARATLEIGSGSVSSGRAVTTTTASNQVRTSPNNMPPSQNSRPNRTPQYRLSMLNNDRYHRELTCGPPEKLYQNRKILWNDKRHKPNSNYVRSIDTFKDCNEDDVRDVYSRSWTACEPRGSISQHKTPKGNKSYGANISYTENEDIDEKWNRVVNNWYGGFAHYTCHTQKLVGEFSTGPETINSDSKTIEQHNNVTFVTENVPNAYVDSRNTTTFNNKNIQSRTFQGNRNSYSYTQSIDFKKQNVNNVENNFVEVKNTYGNSGGVLLRPRCSLNHINRRNIRSLTIGKLIEKNYESNDNDDAKMKTSHQHDKTNISDSCGNINNNLKVKSRNEKANDCIISSRTSQNNNSNDVTVRAKKSKSKKVKNSPTVCSHSNKRISMNVKRNNNEFNHNDSIKSNTFSNANQNDHKLKANKTDDAKVISKKSHKAFIHQKPILATSMTVNISEINVSDEIDKTPNIPQEIIIEKDETPIKLTANEILKDNCLTINENANNPKTISEVSSAFIEVDSAIPFSCITTPEIVSSCNTTTSTTQSDAVDLKQPRSVVSSSFNGLPLTRPNYGSTASTTDEYKVPILTVHYRLQKSLDENGNAVQGFSSPLSGSSQHKKPRRKKSSKNETVIKSHQIDGYQGNKDLNEVLRFIESNADSARANKLGRAKHKDDSDDKCGKKRSTERRKDKENKIKRATSMEELSRTKLEDLTDNDPPLRAGKARWPDTPPAKPERRSWGDDARAALLLRADELGAGVDAEPVPDPATELTDFQTVTKKRKPRRRTDEAEREPATEPAPRRTRAPSPRARRISAPPSDRSNDSNDDMDSVHSLPADATRARPPPPAAPPSHVSYADIARTRHNIPDLIESCNFYGEGEAEGGAGAAPAARADAEYPALAAARRARDKAAGGAGKERDAPAPDVVADRRPPVILLAAGARSRDLDGVTFGFDVNEQLLGGARADVVRDAEAGAAPAARGACAALRYVPPPAHQLHQLHLIVDYVAAAAAHHDDMHYLMTLRFRFPDIGLEGLDAQMVDRMIAFWYNFARYGDPNFRDDTPELADIQWPPMKPEDRTYLRVDKELSLHKNLKEDRMQLWEELYPIQY